MGLSRVIVGRLVNANRGAVKGWALRLAWALTWPADAALHLLWRRKLWDGPMWRRSLAAWALAQWGSLAYDRHAWRNGMSFERWLEWDAEQWEKRHGRVAA